MSAASKPGRGGLTADFTRAEWRLLVAASLPLAVGSVNLFGVNLALADIQGDLGLHLNEMRWVLIAFLLPDILMMPLAGRYGDYFGRRRLLFIGALVFALGALLSAASAGFGMLLASRAVEGLGAGVMFGGLLAIIADSFGERRLGRAFGTWGGLGAIAFGLSPFIAGVLIDGGGWRWLFALNALLALAAAALVLRLLSEDRRGERPNWDPPGLLLLVAGLALLAVGAVQGPTWGWGSAATLLFVGVGAVLLPAAVLVETRARDPLWSRSLGRARGFLAGTWGVTAAYMVQELTILIVVVYLFFVRELSLLETGLVLLAMSLVWMLLSPLSGRLADRFGAARVIATGGCFGVAGAIVLAAGFSGSAPSIAALCIGLALLETGAGLTVPGSNAAAMRNVAEADRGEASGASMTARLTGATLGIAAGASLLLTRHDTIVSNELAKRGADPELLVAEDLGALLDPSRTDDRVIAAFGGLDELVRISASSFESAASTVFVIAAVIYLTVLLTWARAAVRGEGGG